MTAVVEQRDAGRVVRTRVVGLLAEELPVLAERAGAGLLVELGRAVPEGEVALPGPEVGGDYALPVAQPAVPAQPLARARAGDLDL